MNNDLYLDIIIRINMKNGGVSYMEVIDSKLTNKNLPKEKQEEIIELFKKLEIPIKQDSNKKVSKCSLYDSNQKSVLNNTTQMRIDGRYYGRLV